MLVGGGELHDRWETLVPVRAPLSRGIQRFTGVTQAMVDEAPPTGDAARARRAARGPRVGGYNAAFDRRVLAQAFGRAGVAWPDPPALCTVALARRLHPLARQRKLGPLAESLGIDVDVTHRALADAETCARVLCALFPRLCANAGTVGQALARCWRPSGAGRRAAAGPTAAGRCSACDAGKSTARPCLPEPGVYIFRNAEGQPLYVGKSVDIRARAKAHFRPSSPDTDWIAQAETVDWEQTNSEVGALLTEHRLIKQLRPPGNERLKHSDQWVYLRCRLDIAYPILEIAPEPAPGLAVNVGPLRGRFAAAELVEQLQSLFALRHCGRGMKRREHPSAYGQMGRCLSPCLGDLDPNAYRRRLDEALALFTGDDPAPHPPAACAPRRRDARGGGPRALRAGRLAAAPAGSAWPSCWSASAARWRRHARPRLVLAAHPEVALRRAVAGRRARGRLGAAERPG